MSEKTIPVRQKQKYDSSENWNLNNPVLLAGELGIESDTRNLKVGDGVSAWNELPYVFEQEEEKTELTTEEIALIEEHINWYNNTFLPQYNEKFLNFKIGDSIWWINYHKLPIKDRDPGRSYLYEDGWDLENELKSLEEEVESRFKTLREAVMLSLYPEDLYLYSERPYWNSSYSKQALEKINPILLNGQPMQETDHPYKIKVGDGTTAWNDLDYYWTGDDIPSTENPEGESETTPET